MASKKFSYKAAMQEISAIVQRIENEEIDVDELSAQVKKASELIRQCKSKLKNTGSELENIIENLDK